MRNQFRAGRVHDAMSDPIQFVIREARLLDEKRFDEWYELFAEDGHYWVPASPNQPDPLNHNSLAYEDKLLLKLRIERLKQPTAYS
jgi:3-phenylpropionate/cinnamic acid dioxygenase small subunit